VAENPQPVLVYNRIDENRQNTWFLIGAFVVLMLPDELITTSRS
jgi:hypothetical protein